MQNFKTIKKLANYIFSKHNLSVWKREGNIVTLSNWEEVMVSFDK